MPPKDLDLALRLLTPIDQLVMQVILKTGLRISDVLTLRTDQIRPRLTVKESKTGKTRRVTIGQPLADAILAQAGEVWAFPGANRGQAEETHRSRQAVWRDLHRAAKACRLPQLSPHSGRKAYAVDLYQSTGDLATVQRRLQHDNLSTTLLYALADHLAQQPGKPSKPRR